LVIYNLLTPLARVYLSKYYINKTTTMYRSLRIQGNRINNYVQIIAYPGERDLTNIFRPDTEINRNNRL